MCGLRAPHVLGVRIAPCAQSDSVCSECNSECTVRWDPTLWRPPFATLAGGALRAAYGFAPSGSARRALLRYRATAVRLAVELELLSR
eukprot:375708-Prymnesium_polylepis.1